MIIYAILSAGYAEKNIAFCRYKMRSGKYADMYKKSESLEF